MTRTALVHEFCDVFQRFTSSCFLRKVVRARSVPCFVRRQCHKNRQAAEASLGFWQAIRTHRYRTWFTFRWHFVLWNHGFFSPNLWNYTLHGRWTSRFDDNNSFIFMSAFSLGRVAEAESLGRHCVYSFKNIFNHMKRSLSSSNNHRNNSRATAISDGSGGSTPRWNQAKWEISHSTWSLGDLWAAFPWV